MIYLAVGGLLFLLADTTAVAIGLVALYILWCAMAFIPGAGGSGSRCAVPHESIVQRSWSSI